MRNECCNKFTSAWHSTLIFFVASAVDDPKVMGPDGMEKFCEDIGVEPENVSSRFHFCTEWGFCFFVLPSMWSLLLDAPAIGPLCCTFLIKNQHELFIAQLP